MAAAAASAVAVGDVFALAAATLVECLRAGLSSTAETFAFGGGFLVGMVDV